MHEVPSKGIVEDILGKFWIRSQIQTAVCRYYPVRNEKIGIIMGVLGVNSKGCTDHQLASSYFSERTLKIGI